MRILIYGGSFNPPHIGHIRSAQTAAQALTPDKVFFMSAAMPPHKQLAQGSPAPEHRLQMAALAAREVPGGEALDIELHRQGPSYTSDTLRELHGLYPEAELVFLVGTDMLLTLDQWHEPEVILALASIAVFSRETGRDEEIEAKADVLRKQYGAVIYVIHGAPVEVSSTEIRELLPQRAGREHLSEDVYAYIIRHRLYGARPDFVWLRERAYAYLKSTRVPHVQGTEQEARRLAKRWGVSEEDAAEAAILHDITKKLPQVEQLRLCEKYGIMADKWELENDRLLHAKTGAALAADVFGVPEHIAQAIRWHTTGRPEMSDLEKIIFLADYIEPNRAFPSVDVTRKAAYEDLDAAMESALRRTLAFLPAQGEAIHPDTERSRQWFLKQLEEKGTAPIQWTPDPEEI